LFLLNIKINDSGVTMEGESGRGRTAAVDTIQGAGTPNKSIFAEFTKNIG